MPIAETNLVSVSRKLCYDENLVSGSRVHGARSARGALSVTLTRRTGSSGEYVQMALVSPSPSGSNAAELASARCSGGAFEKRSAARPPGRSPGIYMPGGTSLDPAREEKVKSER